MWSRKTFSSINYYIDDCIGPVTFSIVIFRLEKKSSRYSLRHSDRGVMIKKKMNTALNERSIGGSKFFVGYKYEMQTGL